MKNKEFKEGIKTEDGLMNILKEVYDKVTDESFLTKSVRSLANDYRRPGKSTDDSVDTLIKWQCSKSATSGLILNLGGLMTLPFTLPMDLMQNWYIQLRMAAAIAHLYEYDINSDQVKTFCIMCLCGNAAQDILTKFGKKSGEALAKKAIHKISGETLKAINKAVGYRLFTKAGSTGVFNLTKMLPLVGGIIGGSVNITSTYAVGKAAKLCFK